MEIHQLRYFLALIQTGSFTGASEVCNVSQPSLSAQIAKLEDELGGPLFERSRHGSTLTPRGELFRIRAAEALRQLEIGRFELEELAGLRRGAVVLGCLPTTGAHILPPILKAFHAQYPQIQIQLREESSPVLAKALHEAEVELVIMDEAGIGPGLQTETLFTESLLIALPPGHRLSGATDVDLSVLEGEPMILMKKGHGFRQIVLKALARAGVEPRILYESDEIETVQALVEAGLGVSLVPSMVKKSSGPAYASIKGPSPTRTVVLAWRNSSVLSPAAEALKEVALRSFRQGRTISTV